MWKTRSGRRYSEDENANARFERRALGCVEIGKTIFGRWEFVDGVWTDLKGRAYLKTDIREVRCENRYVKDEICKVSFARQDLEDKVCRKKYEGRNLQGEIGKARFARRGLQRESCKARVSTRKLQDGIWAIEWRKW